MVCTNLSLIKGNQISKASIPGIPLELPGTPWNFPDFPWDSPELLGTPRNSPKLPGIPLERPGTPWNSLELLGTLWSLIKGSGVRRHSEERQENSKGDPGSSEEFRKVPREFLGVPGSWKALRWGCAGVVSDDLSEYLKGYVLWHSCWGRT